MGWTGQRGTGTHAEIDAELMRPWQNGDVEVTKTDCRLVNFNEHYHVIRYDGEPIVIAVTMIRRSKGRADGFFGGSPEWLYKDMSEDMGPGINACPLDLLDIVPEPKVGPHFSEQAAKWAQEWRAGVRDYHAARRDAAARAGRLTAGTRIRLIDGLRIGKQPIGGTEGQIVGRKGMKLYAQLDNYPGHVRLAPKHIAATL